jgi:hypothetical protein
VGEDDGYAVCLLCQFWCDREGRGRGGETNALLALAARNDFIIWKS